MATEPVVMVTRPAGQQENLCHLLRRSGFNPVHEPLLALRPLAALDAVGNRALAHLEKWDALVFVSANAVYFGMPWLLRHGGVAGTTCFAVGAATREALAARDVEAVAPESDMTSEGLLALPWMRNVTGRHVLIVKGQGGRGHLRQQLQNRGAEVSELACYHRVAPPGLREALANRLKTTALDAILLSSGEGLHNMLDATGGTGRGRLQRLLLVAPSRRVADEARAAGFTRIACARNASDKEMVAALQSAMGMRAAFRNGDKISDE